MKKKSMDWYKQQQRFSVRKYHFGAASVLLGTALVFGGAQASADEVTAPATPSTESTTATSAETTTASEGAPAVLTASEATPASLTASEASSSTEATSLDKGALQVALSQAKALDLSNKTSETVAILLAQIEHAQNVLNTATSQEELNQAVTDLQAAQAQLADKPAQPVAVSPASVATTPAPATSTPSSTPEATTPASVTASSPSSTSEATTSASTATVETSSSSPVVATPTRSRRTRRAVPSVVSTPKVTFYDANGNEVTSSSIVDGKDGKNISLNMKIEMPDDATDRKVTVTLGNFLSFVDNPSTEGVDGAGQTNETVKLSAKLGEVEALEDTIKDKNGVTYKDGTGKVMPYGTNLTTTYTLNKGISTLIVPLNLRMPQNVAAKGISSTGSVNGITDRVEKSTPVTVTNGTTVIGEVHQIIFDEPDRHLNAFFPNIYAGLDTTYQNPTDKNGYQFNSGLNLWNSRYDSEFDSTVFVEKGSYFDILLPNGVSYVGKAGSKYFTGGKETDRIFTVNNLGTNPAGQTTIRVTFNEPTRRGSDAAFFAGRFQANPAVVGTSVFPLTYQNFNIKLRNHQNNATITLTRDATSPFNPVTSVADNRIISNVPAGEIISRGRGDSIAYGQTVPNVDVNLLNDPTTLNGAYVPLGYSSYYSINNPSTSDTGEKEYRYTFPNVAEAEVKGVYLQLLDNGYELKTAKVASKNNPVLHEVNLSRSFEYKKERYSYLGLKDLGLSEDDTLTELIVPIGKVPAGYSADSTNPAYFSANAFGVQKDYMPSGKVVATITLRDKDYNPADPNRNKTLPTTTMTAISKPSNTTTLLAVNTPNSIEIQSGDTNKFTYEVFAGDSSLWAVNPIPVSRISKAYVVLPKDVNVQDIAVRRNTIRNPKDPSYEIKEDEVLSNVVTNKRIDGNNAIYELDLGSITDNKNLVGPVADYNTPNLRYQNLKFDVTVKNDVDKKKVINLDKTFFVVPTKIGANIGDYSVQADPYNLNSNHSYVFTNRPTTNTLTLSKYDKLEINSEAKLNTDPTYVDASNTFKLESTTQNIDLKYTVKNPNNADAANVEMYIPVPKVGQNWGTNFQSAPFDYGLALKSPASVDPAFNAVYDIEYATVDASKLDGSTDHNALTLANETYTTNPTNLNDVNLIRIKTKAGVKVPANSALPVELSYKVVSATNADDGKTLGWSPYYKAQFDDYTSLNHATTTNLQLTLGATKVQAFNDANANGLKDAVDTLTSLAYKILDDTNNVVADTTSQTSGPSLKTGLVSGKTYTVIATNPDALTYKFTNGTSSADRTTATYTVVPAINGSSTVPTVSIGLATRTLADKNDPVGQDVPAKHGETPAAVNGIANTGDMPAGTTYDWKVAPDTSTPGTKPSTVLVKYSDGSVDEVPVNVNVAPQVDEYTPVGQDVPAKHGETPNAADGIANKGDLPANTKYDWKTPVDTSTPGDKPATVVVTYPDGTNEEVPVTVKVSKQSDDYTPVGKDVPAKHGDTPSAASGIANKGDLPTGTTYDWKTPVDTTTPGDKPGTVVVTYPDGTKDEVPVTVKVQPQADDYDPQAQPVSVDHGATPNAEDGIANKGTLPPGTTYDWKTPIDTSTPGTKPGTVVVTYPDGTKDEVPVPVTVGEEAALYTPVGQDVPAKHGETPAASQGIANRGTLPAGTTYDWKTPVDTTTPGDKPATVVVTYPDGSKDEVPVTVKVKPQSDEFTPNGQDVPTKHGETPNAADGIANKGDLPAGTTYDWKTPVDTSTPGDKPGTVVVTYPDGTKDEVPVTVKVKPQSDEFTPTGQDVPAKHGETPNAADGIANKGDLPAGTTYDWKTPVDTSTPGDKPGTVVVTYPDGTKDEVPVTVKVKPQSDEFTPQPKDVSTDHGKTPKAEDGVANKGDLPDGTKYDWKTPVDTTTPGDKPGTVVVTYPDGTKDEVPVTVHVGSQSDLYNPDGQNLNVKQGDQPEASKGIANRGNLPDGTTYDWKTPVDTSTVGDKPATVVVTYPDGSKDEVPVTVKVTEKLHVKTPADKVPVKDPSHLTPDDINKVVENIKKENPGLPDDAKITVNPNGGDTTIETKDGDKVTIPGSDLVRPETDADKNNVKVPADKVPVKDPSNLTDAEKDKVKDNIKKANPDLPNGTKIDVAKDGTATITFPDGSTKVIPGSDLVRPETDADRHTPKGQDVPVKQGETPKAEDGIANKGDLPNGTKIEWKETPDTSKVGDHNATIVITYPDGSKDEVTVTVKVSPNANNNGHNGNNGSQGNGNSGSHNNGTNGDQGQGDKDKKDQAGKDTNNGLGKLFSNSGNGSASGDQSGVSRKQAPALPNTGDASNPAMALAFAALLGGTALAMKKRKKEEEE